MEIQLSLTEEDAVKVEKSIDHIILTFNDVPYFKDYLDLLKKIDMQIKNIRISHSITGTAKALWEGGAKCSTVSCEHSSSAHSGNGNGCCSSDSCPCLKFS